MILWILIIATILLFVSFVVMNNSWYRTVLVFITGVIMVGSVWAIHQNDENHLGMHQVTTSSTKVVYSASPSKALPLLLYKNVGTSGKHNVYVYKTSTAKKAKTQHTYVDYRVTNKVTTSKHDVAQLTNTKREWVYKNGFYKLLFNGLNNHHLIKETNTFKVPSTWYTLTTTQAKALSKKLKAAENQTATQKAAIKAAIEKQVAAAKAKDPAMTTTQMQALAKQLTAKYQQQAIAKAVKEVKANN